MIVFQKDSSGKWERTGDQLPTETHMQILVDADSKPMNGVYTYPEAIKLVEDAIEKNKDTDYHYRFEIVGASAKALSRAGIRATAPAPKAKRPAKESKPKAAPKAKPEPKAKAAKKETGKQRRARLIRENKCTACGKRAPRKGRRECGECAEYYRTWAAKKGGK